MAKSIFNHVDSQGQPITRKLSVRETAIYLGVSDSWLNKKRLEGGGPPFLKLGRRVLYDARDIEVYLATARRLSTSEH